MKKMSKNVLFIVIGILIAFTIDVAAEAVISSGAVSYSNSATSETTVSGALDELFSAVDINSTIGTTDISGIGDGTITGALAAQQNEITTLQTCEILYSTAFINVQKCGNRIIFQFSTATGHADLLQKLNVYATSYPPLSNILTVPILVETTSPNGEYLGYLMYNGNSLKTFYIAIFSEYPGTAGNTAIIKESTTTKYNVYGTISWTFK